MRKDISPNLIAYFWESGSYTIEDMIRLVLEGTITEKQFQYITSFNFQGVYDKKRWGR